MKVNSILMDLARGQWLMSLDGASSYMPLVHQILTGQAIDQSISIDSLISVLDDSGRKVTSQNGQVNIPANSIAVIDMIGPVTKYSGMCNHGADAVLDALQMAENNPNIIGTIFKVDSPGGAVSAIGPFLEFAQTRKKPIVALVDTCASLAYWAVCAIADHIMVDNDISACIGSVGVVMTLMDDTKYLEEKGYKLHEVYPKESEHKNKAFQLAKQGNYDMINEEVLSPLAIKFQNGVRAARPNLKEETGVLTGKTFMADKALQLGMIDSIGNLSMAINFLKVKSEMNHYN